jgi:hypothetical protein
MDRADCKNCSRPTWANKVNTQILTTFALIPAAERELSYSLVDWARCTRPEASSMKHVIGMKSRWQLRLLATRSRHFTDFCLPALLQYIPTLGKKW